MERNELIAIENLKKGIYTAVNDSGLSVATVYYVFKDIFNEIIVTYNNQMRAIAEEMEKEKESSEVEVEKED
jgi:hypothetical protein